MVRLVGSCMILSGCLGIGLWYRAQFNGRIKVIRTLETILEQLCSEVRYGRSTLPECCSRAAGNFPQPLRGALERIGRSMRDNTGLSFGEVFQREFEEALAELPLRSEDREAFLQFAQNTCYADGQMQLRAMELSRELLGQKERELEGENAGKCRMAVGLGAMSGMLLILILW